MAKLQAGTILIMAGGTGGHIYPALAVADNLRTHGISLYWLGTRTGLEARLIPAAGLELITVTVAGLRRQNLVRIILAPAMLLIALIQSIIAILRVRPGVVLGMGGFASGPGGLAAWICRRPLIIHEQNAIPGLTNRILARFAATVLQAFPDSFDSERGAVHTGNPIRADIIATPAREQRVDDNSTVIQVLVFGGSRGAHALNESVPPALAQLQETCGVSVQHQTGDLDEAAVRDIYQASGVDAQVSAYIDDMAAAYAAADLVISRAGAITVAEIAAAGVASILVPYPYAVDDHQTANAQHLSGCGAAIVVPQQTMTSEGLAEILRGLVSDRARLAAMARQARAAAVPDATERVARHCMELLDA